MDADVIGILRCPITKRDLRSATDAELTTINKRVVAGELTYVDGQPVERELDAALVSIDDCYAYRIDDGIAVLMAPSAVALSDDREVSASLGAIKAGNQTFYDELGWQKDDDGAFTDALKFEDLRPVSAEYIHRCHLRVNDYLEPQGRFLVDAASGPVQFSEYLTYSRGYSRRICIDLSYRALLEARRALGDHGVYLLADVTNLPLQDSTADAVVSLHTIYHVPEDEQSDAFRELHRVLAPGRRAVVVYTWHRSLLMKLAEIPVRAARLARRLINPKRSAPPVQPAPDGPTDDLYFHPKGYLWFVRQKWPFHYRIAAWRSLSVPFMQLYVRERLAGRQFLTFVYRAENRWPGLLGRLGQYPLIVIEK